VDPEDIIIWQGSPKNTNLKDAVNISSINCEKANYIFGTKDLHGNRDTPELVIGKVRNGTNRYNEKYIIKFSVYDSKSNQTKDYQIDPKIAVRPKKDN
jgi:hypothetical protein